MKSFLHLAITVYQQLFSTSLRILFGKGCRYTPSCSVYSQQAISQYGIIKGTALTVRRLSRCHPFSSSGYDPIP